MLQLIKYDVKVKVHNFQMIFWPLVFPLLLGTFFYFAIGNVKTSDFETVPTAVVVQSHSVGEQAFLNFLHSLESNGNHVIKTKRMQENEAVKALKAKKVSGIYYVGKTETLTVAGTGMKESILQSLLQSYENGKQTMENVASVHPEGLKAAGAKLTDYQDFVKEVSLGGKTINGTAQFFYVLIAMACLYGCFIGFGSAIALQANLSALGARRCATPTHKLKLILSEMLTSFGIHFINVTILLIYLKYILHMEFGGKMPQMLIISLMGCIIGVSIGIFISSILKQGEGLKLSILLAISMGCSFMAGMMSLDIKFKVDKFCPIINKVNPAAVISDAFYCVNVYDDPVRLRMDLLTLLILSVVLITGTFLVVRRERYDSI